MKLTINGEPVQLAVSDKGLNVSALLVARNVEMPDMVSVQLNGEFVESATFATTFLKDGDEVDFLYFMGGGSPIHRGE